MTILSDAARRAIEAPRLAHLTTLNPNGSPQVSAVWVGLDGEEIVTAHLGRYRKLGNVENDPRVALSVEAEGSTHGLDNYLVIYGRARVIEGGAPELLQRLAETYLGPGIKFPPRPNPPPGYVMRIAVERVAGIGPWKARTEA